MEYVQQILRDYANKRYSEQELMQKLKLATFRYMENVQGVVTLEEKERFVKCVRDITNNPFVTGEYINMLYEAEWLVGPKAIIKKQVQEKSGVLHLDGFDYEPSSEIENTAKELNKYVEETISVAKQYAYSFEYTTLEDKRDRIWKTIGGNLKKLKTFVGQTERPTRNAIFLINLIEYDSKRMRFGLNGIGGCWDRNEWWEVLKNITYINISTGVEIMPSNVLDAIKTLSLEGLNAFDRFLKEPVENFMTLDKAMLIKHEQALDCVPKERQKACVESYMSTVNGLRERNYLVAQCNDISMTLVKKRRSTL
jgi:hypothetical protein